MVDRTHMLYYVHLGYRSCMLAIYRYKVVAIINNYVEGRDHMLSTGTLTCICWFY